MKLYVEDILRAYHSGTLDHLMDNNSIDPMRIIGTLVESVTVLEQEVVELMEQIEENDYEL